MRYVNVMIHRSEALTNNTKVRSWEIPILKVVHGPEKVTVGGFEAVLDRLWPTDIEAEWDRLVQRFGSDLNGAQETPFIEMVYGNRVIGIEKLKEVIETEKKAHATWMREEKAKASKDPLVS